MTTVPWQSGAEDKEISQESANRPNSRIVCIQPQVPHYRVDFFKRLDRHIGGRLLLLHGTRSAGESLVDAVVPGLAERQQAVPWSRLCRQPSMRAVFARLKHRPAAILVSGLMQWPLVHLLLLWGAWTRTPVIAWCQLKRAGFRPGVVAVKARWLRLFGGVLLYTDAERSELLAGGFPARRLSAMNNGLAWREVPQPDADRVHTDGAFIHCARLETKNRGDLLVTALAAYRAAGGHRRLLVIGDGAERWRLANLAAELQIAGQIDFLGAIYEQDRVDALVASAYAMVHPFGVGLSIVSALVAGCPLVACTDRRLHMPEFWLWRRGVTGWGFAPGGDETAALAGALAAADRTSPAAYRGMRAACRVAAHQATTAGMAERAARALAQWQIHSRPGVA